MSVASELLVLAQNKAGIKAAIEYKNPSIPPTDALSSFPPAISSIQSGGGGELPPFPVPERVEWEPLSSWPDIKSLLSNDQEDYPYKIYVLWDTDQASILSNTNTLFTTTNKTVTQDGDVYTENDHHFWRDYGTGPRYRWTAHYSSNPWTKVGMTRVGTISYNTAVWIVSNTGFSSSTANAFLLDSQYRLECVDFPEIRIADVDTRYGAQNVFRYCYNLRKIPDKIEISATKKTASMFQGCTMIQDVPGELSLSASQNTSYLFADCRNVLSVPETLDTGQSTNTSYMFSNCYYLRKVPDVLDTGNSTNTSYMFSNCHALSAIPSVLNTSKSTTGTYMFNQCRNITSLPNELDTHLMTTGAYMFYGCFNLRNIPYMNVSAMTSLNVACQNCYSLSSQGIDLTNIPKCTTVANMFNSCFALENAPSAINAPSATTLASMFANCITLEEPPVSVYCPVATTVASMFASCYRLKKGTRFTNLNKCTTIGSIYSMCISMEEVPPFPELPLITTTASLFSGCYSLVEVPGPMDISHATSTNSMFQDCKALRKVPDVLDVSNKTTVANMYSGCYSLSAIPDIVNLKAVTSSNNQNNFSTGCFSLKRLPTHVTTRYNLSFQQCAAIEDLDSVATFDDPDNPTQVTGGFIGNLQSWNGSQYVPATTIAGQKITLSNRLKNFFTADQISLMESNISQKNFTLAWA